MKSIEMFLGFPPSVNNYYAKTQRGVYISSKGKRYRAEVLSSVVEQLGHFTPIDDKIMIEVILYPPDRRVRDVDNYSKSLLDALTQAEVWRDDSLIDQMFVYRGAVVKGGAIAIRISDAGPILPYSTVMDFPL